MATLKNLFPGEKDLDKLQFGGTMTAPPPPNAAATMYGVYMEIDESTPPDTTVLVKGLWADTIGELLTFYTSSNQWSGSKGYHYLVAYSASSDCGDEDVFSVAYGHYAGSGSVGVGGQISDTPSRAIYGQYRTMLIDTHPTGASALSSNTKFSMPASSSNQNKTEIDDIYVITINRSKFKDKLDPGNFQLNLTQLNGTAYGNNFFTGSNVQVSSSNAIISLIDDSGETNESLDYDTMLTPTRNLVSGTLETGVYNPSAPHYYGLVYPDKGTIIISAKALNQSASFNTVTGSGVAGDNSYKLFTSISGSGAQGVGKGFAARSIEKKEISYHYIRVYPYNANYSNNPTFTSGSKNEIDGLRAQYEPNVYITSIGLYNNLGDLLAIAKMSKPIIKNYNSELSITVKLEY